MQLCSIIFEKNVLVTYLLFKTNFLIDHHCETLLESFDTLAKCPKCLMFLQGVEAGHVEVLTCLGSIFIEFSYIFLSYVDPHKHNIFQN